MRIVLALVSIAGGVAAVSPVADALAPKVVGGAVPTRIQDLAGYLTLTPSAAPPNPALLGPVSPTDPTQAGNLRELAALSFGVSVAIMAVLYVVGGKLLGAR